MLALHPPGGHCGHCVTVIVEDHRDLDRVTVAAHWTHCATPRARGPDIKVDTRIRHHVRQVKEVKRK